MPIRLNTLLNVSAESLDEKGVFNSFIDMDSTFHVDPSLLETIEIDEFEDCRNKFDQHFKDILQLLKISSSRNDKAYKAAVKKLKFKEIPYISLGFSKTGNHGAGIGKVLAEQLAATGKEIADAGFENPRIFELIGLFEEGIGADRISDMTISIIYENLIKYTIRITEELDLESTKFKYGNSTVKLPKNQYNYDKPIILLPKDLLNKIPIADSWHDISSVEGYNDQLREKTNKLVGGSWHRYLMSKPKPLRKYEILNNKALLSHLLDVYEIKPKKGYNFDDDPLNEFTWLELANKAQSEHRLNLNKYKPTTPENILELMKVICYQLKSLIENNGWWEFLYDDTGKQRNERYVQKLFYGVADTYCRANNIDVNREPNAGSGPVDFKLSKGYEAKVNLEMKLSTNTKLVNGFTKQRPKYDLAEKSHYSIYLIVMTKPNLIKINKIKNLARKLREAGKRTPTIIVIDGRRQMSASKL